MEFLVGFFGIHGLISSIFRFLRCCEFATYVTFLLLLGLGGVCVSADRWGFLRLAHFLHKTSLAETFPSFPYIWKLSEKTCCYGSFFFL